jgi:hypothetical protein
MIFLAQSIAYFYWFGRFSDLLVTSKVRVRRVAMMTLSSDQQGDTFALFRGQSRHEKYKKYNMFLLELLQW